MSPSKKRRLLDDETPPASLRDEEVLFASVSSPSLFEEIVRRYEGPFRNKVRGIVGNRDEVDDIVQETFLKIYMNAARFEVQEGASFKSWGYKILMNTTFTYYQKLKKDGEALVDIDTEFYESLPDTTEPKKETIDFVASVLVRMPAALSRALKLHFIDGMPQKEIAALEGVSISAVKTRIHRAKKEFKKIEARIADSS
ncbi:MAG: RNA polymerase sigma factor [Parcubacteria group bacterium]|nr:RNA polymerase sigma factor [Parcubacteria group bacterium]